MLSMSRPSSSRGGRGASSAENDSTSGFIAHLFDKYCNYWSGNDGPVKIVLRSSYIRMLESAGIELLPRLAIGLVECIVAGVVPDIISKSDAEKTFNDVLRGVLLVH